MESKTKENTKSLLQRIIEQETEKIKIAIEQAIEDGEEIVHAVDRIKIGDLIVFQNVGFSCSVVLSFNSAKITREAKRYEYEELKKKKQEIEMQLKKIEEFKN